MVSKSSFVSCPSKDSNFLKIAQKPRDSEPVFSQSTVLLVPSIISPILSSVVKYDLNQYLLQAFPFIIQ